MKFLTIWDDVHIFYESELPRLVNNPPLFCAFVAADLISAALIVASVASFVQVMQIKIPGTRFVIGSGLLSVMGVSFSFVPVAQQVIRTLSQCACADVPCTVGGTCGTCTTPLEGRCLTPETAYGKVLGTVSSTTFPPCNPESSCKVEDNICVTLSILTNM